MIAIELFEGLGALMSRSNAKTAHKGVREENAVPVGSA
jgi:hypothetical protein